MKLACLLLILTAAQVVKSQTRENIRVMFYNVENLFDTENDPLTEDNEFTPSGARHWTWKRYNQKLDHIYKVIAGVGGWQAPEIIGLAEVENSRVLSDLLKRTPLTKVPYKIVHFDSRDPRGIDVALLFRPEKLQLVMQKPIEITFPGEPEKSTRDILYVQFVSADSDTLNIFVNHWPSRRGGETETEDLRVLVASVLRKNVDSLLLKNSGSKIIIMGDFNDEPESVSITRYLDATGHPENSKSLLNLSSSFSKSSGSHYFQGQWSVLDQIMVSQGLIYSKKGWQTTTTSAHIYSSDFLLEKDPKNLSRKPWPTYSGPRYLGGFSDHLPVYLDLFLKP